MKITSTDFEYIAEFAKKEAAIVLDSGKEYLVESRLAPLAKDLKYDSLEELVAELRVVSSVSQIYKRALDALTTNETLFFRDFKPFEMLREHILPKAIERQKSSRQLNIWSAACSTGQEPYSLAMLLSEHFPELSDWKVSIIATDLSPTALEQARSGSYSQIEVNRGLPAPLLFKYFTSEGRNWVIKKELRDRIDFREMNLVKAWPIFPPLDVVLIRNVLIYFDVPTKQSILKKIAGCLRKDGALILGSSETTMNLDSKWVPTRNGDSIAYTFGD